MKNKLCIISIFGILALSLMGCAIPGVDNLVKIIKSEPTEIELSSQKITLDIGDEDYFKITNLDDLSNVKVDVADDIIAVEAEDDKISIEALTEGKTTITVSADNCEDVTVTVKVNPSEDKEEAYEDDKPDPDDDNKVDASDDNKPDTSDNEDNKPENTDDNKIAPDDNDDNNPTETAHKKLYEQYMGKCPSDLWEQLLEMDEADESDAFLCEIIKNNNISMNIQMNLDLSNGDYGTGEFVIDMKDFMDQLADALRDEETYLKLMEITLGEEMDAETREAVLDLQDEFLETITAEQDYEDTTSDFDWTYDSKANTITIDEGLNSGEFAIEKDGSFEYYSEYDDISILFVPVK